MINQFRRLLIQIGKVLPFVVCFLACINYAETLFAMATNDYLDWNGVVIPNTRISFFIGQYFEYNIQMLLLLCVVSIAIQTCIYNKLACGYLGINLAEKSYFDFPMDEIAIGSICLVNVAIATYICYKGIRILLTTNET